MLPLNLENLQRVVQIHFYGESSTFSFTALDEEGGSGDINLARLPAPAEDDKYAIGNQCPTGLSPTQIFDLLCFLGKLLTAINGGKEFYPAWSNNEEQELRLGRGFFSFLRKDVYPPHPDGR